jgi:hypothetical protein
VSTITDGVVSSVGRISEGVRHLQVSVQINPGNSGGPLFNDRGQVIGVNTFIIRKSDHDDLALEGLNFALEIRYVHELLSDPSKSLDADEIAAVVRGEERTEGADSEAFARLLKDTVEDWERQGYKVCGGGDHPFTVKAEAHASFKADFERTGEYGVCAIANSDADIDLVVLSLDGVNLGSDTAPDSHPQVRFRCREDGEHVMLVKNAAEEDAAFILLLFQRKK